ncbi:MAG: hypothetical protein KDB11_32525 [Planctomycetales bacterium]|nr:hypothetical protein [Planctomycetales bacterium]
MSWLDSWRSLQAEGEPGSQRLRVFNDRMAKWSEKCDIGEALDVRLFVLTRAS